MKILAAIDLSDSSTTIIEAVKRLAGGLSAEVWLLHAAEPDPAFVGFEAGPQSVRDAVAEDYHREHTELQTLADELRAAGLDATALLVQGSVVETLLAEAEKLSVDMIVVGSHGKGAMHKLLVGSASEGVLRRARCPVLVVPTRSQD